jgi:hypothetical protein
VLLEWARRFYRDPTVDFNADDGSMSQREA